MAYSKAQKHYYAATGRTTYNDEDARNKLADIGCSYCEEGYSRYDKRWFNRDDNGNVEVYD
jgi:hypothetical protein